MGRRKGPYDTKARVYNLDNQLHKQLKDDVASDPAAKVLRLVFDELKIIFIQISMIFVSFRSHDTPSHCLVDGWKTKGQPGNLSTPGRGRRVRRAKTDKGSRTNRASCICTMGNFSTIAGGSIVQCVLIFIDDK